MQENLAQEIWRKNKKLLTYGEIDHLLQQLKSQKSQYTKIQYICSDYKRDFNERPSNLTGAIILLRVFDEKANIFKSLKVYFLDHFPSSIFVNELLDLFQSSKTLIRTDIILQIYDAYYLNFNSKCKVYFIVEQEDVQSNLVDIYLQYQKNEKDIKQIMETAINYCSDRTSIKLKLKSKKLLFPNDYLQFFYLVNKEQHDNIIKLNVLSPDIFTNPQEDTYSYYDESTVSTVSEQELKENRIEEISDQLSKLLINIKKLEIIKSEDLIDVIKQNYQPLLDCHNLQIFDIIAQHPKYDDFELIEFNDDYFILGAKIQGSHYYIKAEKFSSLKQVEEISRKYEEYYQIQNNMFIPINNVETILLENNTYYILVEEKILPNIFKLTAQKPKPVNMPYNLFAGDNKKEKEDKNKITSYLSMEYLMQIFSDVKIHQIRLLQIVVQLIQFIRNLHRHNIYHGSIKPSNIIIHIPIQFSAKAPDIYISNPLFMRTKREEESFQQDVEYDTQEIEYMIYSLLNGIYSNVIDLKALKKFKREISSYFYKLNRQYNMKTTMMMDNENEQIYFYTQKLQEFFTVFESLYRQQLDDKYISINKKWSIALNRYIENKRNMGYYYEDDEEEEDENEFIDNFYSDSSSESYYGQFKSKYDQCLQCGVFELGLEKIKYDFENHIDSGSCSIIKSMSKNSQIKSLYIKGFKFQKIFSIFNFLSKDKEKHSKNYLEDLLRNCKNLQKLKLEVTIDDSETVDLSPIKEMKDLQHIKIKFWFDLCSSYSDSEDKIQNLMHEFRELLEVFKVNRNFKYIDVKPFNILIQSFNHFPFYWYFKKYQFIYKKIESEILQIELEKEESKQGSPPPDLNVSEYLENPKIISIIQRRKDMIESLGQTIDSYFQQFYNQQQHDAEKCKQQFLEELTQFQVEHKYISILGYRVYENEKQLLVLEFENILNEEISSLEIKLQFRQQDLLEIISKKCRSQDRFGCFSNYHQDHFRFDIVESWMHCEYETKIKQQLYGKNNTEQAEVCKSNSLNEKENNNQMNMSNQQINSKSKSMVLNNSMRLTNSVKESQCLQGSQQLKQMSSPFDQEISNDYYIATHSCKHLDNMLYQINIYKDQLNLQKLTFSFDYCDITLRNFFKAKDFFKFSHYNHRSLIELTLKMYFIEDIKQIKNNFFSHMLRHLEEAKSLVKINIETHENKKRIIRRKLIKLKRVVMVGFVKRK